MQQAALEQQEVMAVRGALTTRQSTSAVSAYRREQVLNMSPLEVIKRLYEVGIIACRKNDSALGRKVLNELIAGLNFEHEEIAVGLYRLYDYSKRCIREGKMEEAAHILDELRGTWVEAFKLE